MTSYELLCSADAIQVLSLVYCIVMLIFAVCISTAFFVGHSRLAKCLLAGQCVTLFILGVIGRCL
jgi:hypothetical protein